MSKQFLCPVCGDHIEGDTEDDIKLAWSKHMGTDHIMKSRAWLEEGLKNDPHLVRGCEVSDCKTLSLKFMEDCARVILFRKIREGLDKQSPSGYQDRGI